MADTFKDVRVEDIEFGDEDIFMGISTGEKEENKVIRDIRAGNTVRGSRIC